MDNKRRIFFAVGLGLASVGLAAAAAVRFFPRLMMKMMEKCCQKKPVGRKKK